MFEADQTIKETSTLAAFIDRCGVANYEELVERADRDPDWFWTQILGLTRIRFARPYDRLREIGDGPENIRWGIGGALNLTETCLDAHIEKGLGDKTAIDWVGEDGSRQQ